MDPATPAQSPAAQEIFPQTRARLAEWTARDDVLGVVLVGSKSRGHGDPLSDDDLEVFLTDESFARLGPVDCSDARIEGEGAERRIVWDAQYLPLSDLARKADSSFDLDHWPYERAPVLFDRDGRTAAAVRRAAGMPDSFRAARLRHGAIDAWVGALRGAKTLKRGAEAAARLNVNRGVRAASRVLFALERRWTPLDHWFEAELRTLADPLGVGPRLVEALNSGRPEPLRAAVEALGEPLAAEGIALNPASRNALFFGLVHPANAAERARHATV